MKVKRIIIAILICLLLPVNVFAITYGKVGADTNFDGDVNVPSGSAYYVDGKLFDAAMVIYPQDYATGAGTVGDPWAGDCLQDAVDAVPDGGIVYCRAGYYEIGANTLWYSEGGKTWSLIGDGIEETIIKTTAATGVGIYIYQVNHCKLKGFTLDADTQNANSDCGITVAQSDYTIIEDVLVKNSGQTGINLPRVNYTRLSNVYSHNNYSNGVHQNASGDANSNTHNTYRDIYCWSNGQQGFDDYGYEADPTKAMYNVYDNIQCWDNTKHGIAICNQTKGVISNCSVINNTERGMYLYTLEDFNIHDCIVDTNTLSQLYLNNSKNISFANMIVKNADDGAAGILIDDSHGVTLTSCQSYDDRGTPLQEYALVLTGTNTDISLINCKLEPNATGEISGTTVGIVSWGLVNDDVDLVFGNDRDWTIQYDEGVDNQLLWLTTGTAAGAITDPLYEIIVGATPTANQQVFGIAKGTQASNTALFTVDEDGDVIITGALNLGTELADSEVSDTLTASSCTGLSATATALATGRNIGGISFDGTANIIPRDSTHDHALGSDHQYSGILDSAPVGETVVFGDLLYYDWTAVEWKKAKANVIGTTPAQRIALEGKTDGQTCLMLVQGYIRDDSAFDFGAARIYLNDDVAGTCDDIAPAESGDQIQLVGIGITADILYFNPSIDVGEI